MLRPYVLRGHNVDSCRRAGPSSNGRTPDFGHGPGHAGPLSCAQFLSSPGFPCCTRRWLGSSVRPTYHVIAHLECLWNSRSAAASAETDLSRSEEHTSELQSHHDLVCRLLLEKK